MPYFLIQAGIAHGTVNTTPELWPILCALLLLFVVSACALTFTALHYRS